MPKVEIKYRRDIPTHFSDRNVPYCFPRHFEIEATPGDRRDVNVEIHMERSGLGNIGFCLSLQESFDVARALQIAAEAVVHRLSQDEDEQETG